MRRAQKELIYAAVVTGVPALLGGTIFPSLRLMFLAPLIVFSYQSLPLIRALWLSLGCGLLLDLLTPDARFGMWALGYSITTALLFTYRRHFTDRWYGLPLLTATFSLFSTLALALLLRLFGEAAPLSLPWVITDLILFPLVDALYTLVWVVTPITLLFRWRGQLRRYRLQRPK